MNNLYPNLIANQTKVHCCYCGRITTLATTGTHEKACYLNPKNLTECVNCGEPIKDYKRSKGTCSYACSNTYFRHLRNKPENYTGYRTICFAEHDKKCLVCGEEKIVAVHHVNGNHDDNRPENMVPLCPTHHQYVHSRFKDEVQPTIDKYLQQKYGE